MHLRGSHWAPGRDKSASGYYASSAASSSIAGGPEAGIIRPVSRLRVAGIGAVITALGFGACNAGSLLVVSRPVAMPDGIVSLASHEWERLPAAARLAGTNASATVILTLPQPVTPQNCHDCSGRVARLQRLGVSPERVEILPLSSPGTHGEALATLGFARRAGIHRLLIVTTPYHTRRALAVFQSVFRGTGVQIGVAPATASSPARPDRWWASPYDRWYVTYEWTASAYYALRYQVPIWSLHDAG